MRIQLIAFYLVCLWGVALTADVPPPAVYLPLVTRPYTPPAPDPNPPPVAHTAVPPVDFAAVRREVQQQGQWLSYNKIGFHVGIGGNATGLGDWMTQLDSAGVPFFLKSADHAGPLFEAQELMRVSGVPHTLIYRRTGAGFDVPDYSLPPRQAAALHWALHRDHFPPELDPNLVWLETINEVDKNRSDWLAEFALETAQLALRDGFRWAAFGWSAGEPEAAHWSSPQMLAFLALVGQHPQRLAIALHEYSYTQASIGNWYPHLIGRFQQLFHICDAHGLRRPTVLITEWGWEYQNVPDVESALADIRWAAWLYAAYPEVKGAAVWYLGGGYGDIHDQTQALIAPVRDYSLTHYFSLSPLHGRVEPLLLAPAADLQIPLSQLQTDKPAVND